MIGHQQLGRRDICRSIQNYWLGSKPANLQNRQLGILSQNVAKEYNTFVHLTVFCKPRVLGRRVNGRNRNTATPKKTPLIENL